MPNLEPTLIPASVAAPTVVPVPRRLQGTDGIRAKVQVEDSTDLNPLQHYLQTGLLTPTFFEAYTYAFGTLLVETGKATLGDMVVAGWDSRDPQNHFNHAALSGLQKAGLDVLVLGVMPTPAMPLFMLENKAKAAVVLTASHNPADQNGIKLFLEQGEKFLPEEDEALTREMEKLQDLHLELLPKRGRVVLDMIEGKESFSRLMKDPANSWVTGEIDFSDTVLVVDASKGACAPVVESILGGLGFAEVKYTNMAGAINQDAGVAEIEGKECITMAEITGEDAPYAKFETLQKMQELSKVQSIANGEQKLAALIFDGDGDRCFMLHYMPEEQHILVLSGDALGVLQARYLSQQGKTGLFVNTVESDLAVSLEAAKLGFTPMVTGVGDKWILAQACKAGAETKTEALIPFQIGLEESGHAITPTFLPDDKEKHKIAYAGNGIKAGLNSLVALQQISKSREEYFHWIQNPFPAGVRSTFYVYYVDKSLLEPKTAFRQAVEAELLAWAKELLPAGYEARMKFFPEETSLVYCGFFKDQEMQGEAMQGAAFLRNSGTEDKSSLYLRGTTELGPALEQLGERLHLYALQNLKAGTSEEGKLEKEILSCLAEGRDSEAVTRGIAVAPRVLKEMERKQGLLVKKAGNLQLTAKGKAALSKKD